jgi:hypothetical protein
MKLFVAYFPESLSRQMIAFCDRYSQTIREYSIHEENPLDAFVQAALAQYARRAAKAVAYRDGEGKSADEADHDLDYHFGPLNSTRYREERDGPVRGDTGPDKAPAKLKEAVEESEEKLARRIVSDPSFRSTILGAASAFAQQYPTVVNRDMEQFVEWGRGTLEFYANLDKDGDFKLGFVFSAASVELLLDGSGPIGLRSIKPYAIRLYCMYKTFALLSPKSVRLSLESSLEIMKQYVKPIIMRQYARLVAERRKATFPVRTCWLPTARPKRFSRTVLRSSGLSSPCIT